MPVKKAPSRVKMSIAGIAAIAHFTMKKTIATDVEQFVAHLSRDGVGAHAVARKISCLATFYKWARRNNKVQEDPIYQIEKPKRPRRIPVWLETEEQSALTKATRNYDDIPENVFGRSRAFSMAVRQRYDLLFELFQKSGLRISEALGLKVQHIRVVDGVAKHVRVIGKGNKERQVPLPETFGRVFALSLAGKNAEDYMFAKSPVVNLPALMRSGLI